MPSSQGAWPCQPSPVPPSAAAPQSHRPSPACAPPWPAPPAPLGRCLLHAQGRSKANDPRSGAASRTELCQLAAELACSAASNNSLSAQWSRSWPFRFTASHALLSVLFSSSARQGAKQRAASRRTQSRTLLERASMLDQCRRCGGAAVDVATSYKFSEMGNHRGFERYTEVLSFSALLAMAPARAQVHLALDVL